MVYRLNHILSSRIISQMELLGLTQIVWVVFEFDSLHLMHQEIAYLQKTKALFWPKNTFYVYLDSLEHHIFENSRNYSRYLNLFHRINPWKTRVSYNWSRKRTFYDTLCFWLLPVPHGKPEKKIQIIKYKKYLRIAWKQFTCVEIYLTMRC